MWWALRKDDWRKNEHIWKCAKLYEKEIDVTMLSECTLWEHLMKASFWSTCVYQIFLVLKCRISSVLLTASFGSNLWEHLMSVSFESGCVWYLSPDLEHPYESNLWEHLLGVTYESILWEYLLKVVYVWHLMWASYESNLWEHLVRASYESQKGS